MLIGALPDRCKAEKLIMVGDRYLTDIVYGNRNGLLTIRPSPLTMKGDPSVVRMVITFGSATFFKC